MVDVGEIEGQAGDAHMTAFAADTELAQAVVEPWDKWECSHSPVGCSLPVAVPAVERPSGLGDSYHQTCVVPGEGSRTARGHTWERCSCPLLQRQQHQLQIVETVSEGLMKGAEMLAMWAWEWGWMWSLSRRIAVPPREMLLMARKTAVRADIAVASLYHTSIDLAVPAVPVLVEAEIGVGALSLELEQVGQGFCVMFYR